MAVLFVGGWGALAAHTGPGGVASPAAPTAVRFGPAAAHPAVLHGDLVVNAANSPFIISPGTSQASVYLQEGNITVQAGGTLIVRNETVDFLEFVSDGGTLAQRVSHLYTFSVQGKATFQNSSLVTDSTILNAYQKLTLNVSGGGALTLLNSTFEFPGWLSVYGAGSTLTANQSTIRGTGVAPVLIENQSIVGDVTWAPQLWAGGGAHVVLDNSSYLFLDRDNVTHFGNPGPAPIVNANTAFVSNGGGTATHAPYSYPTDSENVTRALLYNSYVGATLEIIYNTNTTQTSIGSTVTVFNVSYPLGPIQFQSGTPIAAVSLPAAAVAAINAQGTIGWLEATGAFDQGASISWNIGASNSGNAVNISDQLLYLVPNIPFNMTFTGVGTTLTAVDSTLDLNWNLTPGAPANGGIAPPTPWGSNKLYLLTGSIAYLANVSLTEARTSVYWNQSAILPDASSAAYFYRWAEVQVLATGDAPVVGAQMTAFYSYDNSEANNGTASSLNALGSADPPLLAYVNAWDLQQGLAAYGTTNANGEGFLLLASSVLQQSSLPDGEFLGGYHVAVTLSGGGTGAVQWGYTSVTPYPNGMTPASPDQGKPIVYSNYRPNLAIGSVTVLVNGTPTVNATAVIGQTLVVQAILESTGTSPINNLAANFSYLPATFVPDLLQSSAGYDGVAAGATVTVNFTWVVNESVVGLHGRSYLSTFVVAAEWNGGGGLIGGAVSMDLFVTIDAAPVTFSFTPPSGTLVVGTEYIGNGVVAFNGSGLATINVTVVGPDNNPILLGTETVKAGPVEVDIAPIDSMGPGSYTVIATAAYNGVTATNTTINAFVIGGSTAPPTNFLDQKIGPLTYLELFIIIGAIVAGIIVALLVLRRSARGKLVECGECGSPIPESATQCPKCGAEFESDIVRCSRCGSTIPADSQVCPECAAQLLGSPDLEKNDPERQGYNDVVERFRAEAKKELGENYNEGAFWDWWKRQPTYLSFSQWKLQQGQGGRGGMGVPPTEPLVADAPAPAPGTPPKRPGGGGAGAPSKPAPAPPKGNAPAPPARTQAPAARPQPAVPAAAAAPAADTSAGMKPCSNCGKEIPPDYLVCPFCGAVTQ